MRQSQLFTKTRKEAPKDEVSRNAQLLIQAGYIHKEMAGVYDYLPLGLRVLRKIDQIVREEMNAIGGQEMILTTLQDPEVWKKTDRWSDDVVDIWFKSKLANGNEVGLGLTHEEPLVRAMKNHIKSYKDLPAYPYQIQTKFRNEIRAKSGIMRTREFSMKDLYSFNKDEEGLNKFYDSCIQAYLNIVKRAGVGDSTFLTFASGGIFTKFSHEFQTVTDAGEDTIFLDRKKKIAVNHEVYTDEVLKELGLNKDDLEEVKAVETANIFKLGTRFSEALDLTFTDEDGQDKFVIMGSYGISSSRLMGTIVELFNDEAGIMWPESVAPYKVHLIGLNLDDDNVRKQVEEVYSKLQETGVEVLLDDRDASAGAKFAEADLIGIPYRVVVSKKTEGKVELKLRNESESKMLSVDNLLEIIL